MVGNTNWHAEIGQYWQFQAGLVTSNLVPPIFLQPRVCTHYLLYKGPTHPQM